MVGSPGKSYIRLARGVSPLLLSLQVIDLGGSDLDTRISVVFTPHARGSEGLNTIAQPTPAPEDVSRCMVAAEAPAPAESKHSSTWKLDEPDAAAVSLTALEISCASRHIVSALQVMVGKDD